MEPLLEELKHSLVDCAALLARLAPDHPELLPVIDQKIFFAREALRHANRPASRVWVKRHPLRKAV